MDIETLAAKGLCSMAFERFPVLSTVGPRRACAVAIPVRDEASRLPACLNALAAQKDGLGRPFPYGFFGVVIFANNCRDGSADLARSLADRLPLTLRIVEASPPSREAHAGNARRAAMDLAGTWLAENGTGEGVILTTDADSRVSPHWIVNNLAAIDAGADAVLGRIVLDEEGELLPQALHRRGRLESAYEDLLTELSTLLDPLDHNPWPNHATISGASLAITRKMYLQVGGLPRVPLGEDKALVAELSRHDAKLRFCPDIQVVTSGRLDGRAPGGVADTLRLRSNDPEAYCDEALEPFRAAMRRAKWRARLRRLHRAGALGVNSQWARDLEASAAQARRICRASAFGAAWHAIESASPLLARRRLTPTELPAQISGARRALARLRNKALSMPQHIQLNSPATVPTLDLRCPAQSCDKEFGGLVAS